MAKRTTGPQNEGDLDEYRGRRDPAASNEPFTAPGSAAARTTRHGEFVVHLHDATRRHYDLRLQCGESLLSFAVPKGPSMDPGDKRLAMRTEAHPLPYLDFEDVIPDGNYGAGAMIAWDRGTVRYLEASAEEGLEVGKLDFELSGYKLRGRFALVYTGGRQGAPSGQWLLMKKKDGFSTQGDVLSEAPESVFSGLTVDELPAAKERAARLAARLGGLGAKQSATLIARRITPMLCAQPEGTPFGTQDDSSVVADPRLANSAFLYELKLDGVRILGEKRRDDAFLVYRTGRPATPSYPEIARALKRLPFDHLILDGEIVSFDDQGRPNFQRLARRIHALRPADVNYAALTTPVTYLVFDVLAVEHHNVMDLPLQARKDLLRTIVPPRGAIRALDHLVGRGDALFEFCRQQGLEGVVAKRLTSRYRQGPERHPDWTKYKCEKEGDFVVVGWTVGSGGRGRLGALDIAAWDGDRFVVVGKVGSGLSDATIEVLLPVLRGLEVDAPEAEGEWHSAKRGRYYVRPEVVVSVRYLDTTEGGHLRFPVFRGVREDVHPDQTALPSRSGQAREEDDAVFAFEEPVAADLREDRRLAGTRRVPLTNQKKVFWPDDGFTKGDLCEYYEAVADSILPYLADRPVVLVRYPDGIEGKHFYQWRVPPKAPKWVRSFPVRSLEEDGKDKTTFIVDGVDTLLFIANLGCIPLHVMASRTATLGMCDFVTVDFDVADSSLAAAVRMARTLRDLCASAGLPSFPKTSGQTGLHVLIPMGEGVTFDTAKVLSQILARLLLDRHRGEATMEHLKDKREGKVFVDVGQVGLSRTIVAPYSVRAYPGARVSTPLHWDEVGLGLDPAAFTIRTVLERLAAQGDPMKEMLRAAPRIQEVVAKLADFMPGP